MEKGEEAVSNMFAYSQSYSTVFCTKLILLRDKSLGLR